MEKVKCVVCGWLIMDEILLFGQRGENQNGKAIYNVPT